MTTLLTAFAPALGDTALHLPSGRVVLALVPVILLVGALIVYCLIDLARAPTVRYLPKPVWALVILFASVPFGALTYLAFGRNRHETRGNPAGDNAARSIEHRSSV